MGQVTLSCLVENFPHAEENIRFLWGHRANLPTENPVDPPTYDMWAELDEEGARMLLTSNWKNRRPKNAKIQQYKRAFLSGHWNPRQHNSGMAILTDGRLGDGQNRLIAFIAACQERPGLRLRTRVTFGLTPHDQTAMDLVTPRTPADTLRMQRDATRSTALAATCKLIQAVQDGGQKAMTSYTHPLTPDQALEIEKDWREHLTFADGLIRQNKMVFNYTVPCWTILAMLHRYENPSVVRAFLDVLLNPSANGNKPENPAVKAHNYLYFQKYKDHHVFTQPGGGRYQTHQKHLILTVLKLFQLWKDAITTKKDPCVRRLVRDEWGTATGAEWMDVPWPEHPHWDQ